MFAPFVRKSVEPDTTPTITEGGVEREDVVDLNSQGLLEAVLKQLKMINLQLTILTDNEIDKEEIDDAR